ncbi:MAG: hypothetical protein HQ490_04345 [Lutibacter sp.]|nr:hypothetical protein [Lutibacter sp.]
MIGRTWTFSDYLCRMFFQCSEGIVPLFALRLLSGGQSLVPTAEKAYLGLSVLVLFVLSFCEV